MTAPAPRTQCGCCDTAVPAGHFCGLCGSDLAGGRPRNMLRPRAFGAEPGERVVRPHLASSLFPQLPRSSRKPFSAAMAVGVAGLLAAAAIRLPSAGIAVAALGLPLLFAFYLHAARVDRDIPRVALASGVVLGALLGLLWVTLSGQLVARSYGVPMAVGLSMHHLLGEGVAIPLAGILMMIIPSLVIRILRPQTRESLAGFAFGAMSALAFTAAATLTRLAPQVLTGLFAHSRPLPGLVIESVLSGITVPVTAAAAGGIFGVLLWFSHPVDEAEEHPHRVRAMLALLAVAGLLTHAAPGVVDIVGMPQAAMLAVHLGATVLALLLLRVAVQLALLHEAHDPTNADDPLLCGTCRYVVPDMAFCTACGVAGRATSLTSRRDRRRGSPVQSAGGAGPQSDADAVYPGFALPAPAYVAPALPGPRFGRLLSRWGMGVTAVAVLLGAVALVWTPRVAHYMCPPDCGKPPTGRPVMALPRFTAADGSFSVSYPAPGSAYQVRTGTQGVTATYTGGDGGVLQLFAEPAAGRSARGVAHEVMRKTHPDAKVDYEIPNALVGYQPGYGEVADDWPQTSTAGYRRVRILVLAAVKNDTALIAFATGPYHAFGPDFGPGPPSGANLEIAQDMGKYVNSFAWRGDPAR